MTEHLLPLQACVVGHHCGAQHFCFCRWPVSAHRHLGHTEPCRQHHHHPQRLRRRGRQEIPCCLVSSFPVCGIWIFTLLMEIERLFYSPLILSPAALEPARGPTWSAVWRCMTPMTPTPPPAAPWAPRPPRSPPSLWPSSCRLWRASLGRAQHTKLQQLQVLEGTDPLHIYSFK